MANVQREIDRTLTHLRNKMNEKGFTQLDVQEHLGWGRSYISQLVTKQKTLKLEQVLRILEVIGVEPAEFWSELYPPPSPDQVDDLARFEAQLQGLLDLLVEKRVITQEDLHSATEPEHG